VADQVTQDQLIADLASYRASLQTPLPSKTAIPAPTATWQPDPIDVAKAYTALEAAKATATANAQRLPPDARCLSEPSEQLVAAQATATAALLWALARPVVDEGMLMQVEAELAQAKAAYEGRSSQLYAEWQAIQLQATVQVEQI